MRRIFPDEGSRLVYDPVRGTPKRNSRVYLFTDSLGTVPAVDLLDSVGSPVTDGFVTSDAYGRLPIFSGPDDLTDTLYAKVGTGPVTPVYARVDDRLDAVEAAAAAIPGDVQAAVDALVDGAPGALDTLNELAAALGDDANFAASVTAALATKALATDLTAEVARASAAEGANATAVAAETTARQSADSTLTTNVAANATAIAAETTARQSADTTLTTNVAANATAIAAETTARTNADSTLTTNVAANAGAAAAAQSTANAADVATRFNLTSYGVTTGSSAAAVQAALQQAVTDACGSSGRAEVYIPAGTWTVGLEPTNLCWAWLTKGIRIRGAGRGQTVLKVPSAAGNYTGLFSSSNPATVDLTAFEMCELTVDYNTGNRPANQAALDAGSRRVVNVGYGDRVRVHDCRFINIDSKQTLMLSGAGGLNDVAVTNNVFEMDAGTTFWHDHSTVYTHTAAGGQGASIRGNAFKGNSSLGARTALETHGSSQQVRGNRVYNYAVGGNLTGISDPSSQGIVWADNLFRSVGAGIYLWADTYGSSVDPGLVGVNIHDNLITLDTDTWIANLAGGAAGISFASSGAFGTRNVTIHDNTIRLLPFTAAFTASNNHSHGVAWNRTAAVTDTNLRIYNNLIDGACAAGVGLESTATLVGGGVWGNTIINPGQGAASGGFATSFTAGVFASAVLKQFRIDNNSLRDDQGTHTMQFPIYLSTIGAGSTGVRLVGNRHFYADATTIAQVRSSTTSGIAVYADYETIAYVVPTGNFEVGSRILDLTSGLERKQTTAANGTSWRRSKSPDLTPSVAAGASIGTSPTGPTITGNDMVGQVTWTAGTGPATGSQAVVTFANAFTNTPVVFVTAGNTGVTGRQVSALSVSTSSFSINFSSAPTAGVGYVVNYYVSTGA